MRKATLVVTVSALILLGGLAVFFMTGNPTVTGLTGTASAVITPANTTPLPPTLSGIVTDANGPVAGAIVQIQGRSGKIQTDKDGSFMFTGITGTTPLVLNAWATGHYIGWTAVNPSAPDWTGGSDLKIALNPLPTTDHSNYAGFTFEGLSGSAACGQCHREYKEWQTDGHSQAATNPLFVALYTGKDVNGRQGQPVQFRSDGTVLPPDPSQPYYGPGFETDMPDRTGNCATCHAPLASNSPNNQNCGWSGCHMGITIQQANGIIPQAASPLAPQGAEGVTCDFCHKISGAVIDPKTKLPPPDMPGILSLQLIRPANDNQQIFFGTLIDTAPGQYGYLPLESESEICAACHYGVMGGVVGSMQVTGGTVIYNSYGEWLASTYSDPKTGLTCQQCHMPAIDANWTVFPERGGVAHAAAPMHSHTMSGTPDAQLLQNAVTMTSSAQWAGNAIQVQVSIVNDKTGHDVPTDGPIRSVILVVEALDANGKPLALAQGPVNPDFSGNYGGLPGKTFAQVLKDNWTGESPTAAYWRAVTVVEDTRLAPFAKDNTNYVFNAPARTAVTVNVKLLYRPAFTALQQQKGLNYPDIVMAQDTVQVPAS